MTATAPPGSAAALLADPALLADLRRQMQRFARLQLGDDASADDAVQEALIGALAGAERFTGRAAARTWVFAILKNKIADQLRARRRTVCASDLAPAGIDGDEADVDLDELLFVNDGHWAPATAPRPWADPEAALSDRQFLAVMDACLDGLPPRLGRVFLMREVVGLDTDEVCTELGIAANNLFVMLHRARLRLRECLDQRWFAERRPC
ncbi:sigma-70 family RNA polymerase sigma factor [Derxia gummosa]|uniref:Sigma-70 family RNA polymerase sigma factor n=1 Tax=Derxia gummosa DSM 723 TaxID=1121388 RepID=A0A8B6X7K5_9BURK|nr:sigma-70 family RNA polymerase sigma factor [Derxia gummosa]